MQGRRVHFIAILIAIIVALVAAGCGADNELTPTVAPAATPTPTVAPDLTPTSRLPLEPLCYATAAYAPELLVANIGEDAVPTALDAVNSGGCQFNVPIAQITITLTGATESQTVVIPLSVPANEISFPLPASIAVPLLDATLEPGRYERTVTVSATSSDDGDAVQLPGFEDVILVSDPDSPIAQLLRAESRWERSGIRSYTYQAAWQCFCIQDYVARVKVRLEDGRVMSTTFVEDGFTGDVPDPERFGTVENLFAIVGDAVAQDAARINASYHAELGYLTEVFVDYDERMADEEQGVTIFTFTTSR